jgi:malate synthase
MDIFDEHMHGPNQYHLHAAPSSIAPAAPVLPSDLLNHQVVGGYITVNGVQANVEAALAYCAAWVSGNGCVPINYLMEDAATAEIARVQLWQWVKAAAKLVSQIYYSAFQTPFDESGFDIRTLLTPLPRPTLTR